MAKSKYIETLEEQYTKKDAKSVLRYKAPDNKWRYIQTSNDASGMPSGGGMAEVKWQELKDKRDAGKLTPGSLYRITDYNCTTTQENTQSAGHQFDIVLLALSEDKLAEEGWAMMHDNIYDVTFSDGVTKKCYLYEIDRGYNVIDISTLLGYIDDNIEINETNKTAITDNQTDELIIPDLTYNYFQNSNLSAWKVWYCLDNDKSRFAWADDSVDEGSPASITDKDNVILYRNSTEDTTVYAWTSESDRTLYTESETPNIGDNLLNASGQHVDKYGTVISYTPAHGGTGPNGRGVIYRLIDEFNNDCPYDFKNIMHTNGSSYFYTFNIVNTDDSTTDASLSYTTSNNKITNFVDFLTGLSNTIPSIMFAVTSSHYICGNVVDMGTRFLILVMAGNILRNTFRICIDVQAALASEAHLTDTTFWNCASFSFFNQLTSPFYINGEPVNINS